MGPNRHQTKTLIHFLIEVEPGKWSIPCRPGEHPNAVVNGLNLATPEPYAVRCNACRATELFKANDRPKPGSAGRGVEVIDGCCC